MMEQSAYKRRNAVNLKSSFDGIGNGYEFVQ